MLQKIRSGALQKAFEQLKAKLLAEGLFDERYKKRIPFLPKKIGVVTSPTGAVIKDIRKLKENEILMESRILAVADVVEAMASHRPYRPTLGIEAALKEIEKKKGILYDAAVADACLRLFRDKGYQLA